MKFNLDSKLELDREKETILNKCIVFGTEEEFVKKINYFERQNYNVSMYKNTYKKAEEYLRGNRK